MTQTRSNKEKLAVEEFSIFVKEKQEIFEFNNFFMPILINVTCAVTMQEYDSILEEIKLIIEEDFDGEFMYIRSVNIIILIITKINTFSKQILKNKLIIFANSVDKIINDKLKCKSSVVIGNVYSKTVDMIKNIHDMFKISRYYMFTSSIYIFRQDVLEICKRISQRYTEKVCTQISYYIGRKEYELAVSEVENLFIKIADKYDADTLIWVKHYLFSYFTLELHNSDIDIDELEELYPDYNANTCTQIKTQLINVINVLLVASRLKKVDNVTTIQKAIAFIEHNYSSPITLEQVSRHIGVSREHICRVFSSQCSCTFVNYVNEYRINKAKEYFFANEYNVSKVAEMVGFSSSKYFSTIFKTIVGITPKKFQMDSRN